MANPSVTYTFSNGTAADASEVNTNFSDIINALTDGTKSLSIDALTVAGAATFNGNVTLGNASGDTITVTGTPTFGAATTFNGDVTVGAVDFTCDTNTLHVDAADNRVGIGTTTPANDLHIENSSAQMHWYATGATTNEKRWIMEANSSGKFRLRTRTDANGTGEENALCVDRSGTSSPRLGIGADPTATLHVQGGARITGLGSGTVSSDGSGNLSGSDGRYKDIIEEFHGGVDIVKRLRPKKWKWKEDSQFDSRHEYVGFVAQEVREDFIEAAPVEQNDEQIMNFDDRAIIAALVNSVKELSKKIEELEAKR